MNATPDPSYSERFQPIYTGALTDVLYQLGRGAQTFPHSIKPLVKGHRIAAPAYTVEWAPYTEPAHSEDHADKAWEMFGSVPPGYAMVATTHIPERSVIGDLAIAYLHAQGCAGVVIDGGLRDIQFNEEIGVPIFCAFTTPQDAGHGRGGVAAWGHEIRVGEVRVRKDDFVVADADGVVIIPRELVDDVLEQAEALVDEEARIREALLAGESPRDLF